MIAAVLVVAPAHAAPAIVVDDDGEQCPGASYTSLGAAVDAASDGDTIRVCAGVYRESVVVEKSVRIIGPVEAIAGFDCFAEQAAAPDDLDVTRFAVLEPPPPASLEATDPLVTLDADAVEVAGLVLQGVIDTTPAAGNVFVAAVAVSDAGSGHRVHDNVFRSNTLGMEFGSSGSATSRIEHNCFRENRYGVANQRFELANASIRSNGAFRIGLVAIEAGWAARPVRDVVVRDNLIREASYGVFVENASSVRVTGNDVREVGIRGIWVSAGNAGVSVSGNSVDGVGSVGGTPVGVAVTGPVSGLARSTGIAIQDNAISGIRTVTGAGFGIAVAANALDGGAVIADNSVSGNGLAGIAIFNNSRNVVVRDNTSVDNVGYGVRVQGVLASGNVLRDNMMSGNGVADASDATDVDPSDGIRLLNTWIDNSCVTDEPVGAICGPA